MASKRAMLRSTPGSSSTTATFEPPLASAASSAALPFGLGTSSAMRKAAPCGCVMDMTRLRDVIFHNYGEVSSVKPWSSLFSYGTLYAGRAPHDEPRCPGPQSRLKDPTMPSAKQHYDELLADVYSWMLGGFDSGIEKDGRFMLTFRDLTKELTDLDRFIPVRSDDTTIFTCFLEYEPRTVKVHDLLYRREAAGWRLSKSCYRKLRLSSDWVASELAAAGFEHVDVDVTQGLVTIEAAKRDKTLWNPL